jgi:hypothetical protein
MHSKNQYFLYCWHYYCAVWRFWDVWIYLLEKTGRCCKLSLVLVGHTKCFSYSESIESCIMYADQKQYKLCLKHLWVCVIIIRLWHRSLCHHLEVTRFCFQHNHGKRNCHTGNLIEHQELSSVRFPTQGTSYPQWFLRQTLQLIDWLLYGVPSSGM